MKFNFSGEYLFNPTYIDHLKARYNSYNISTPWVKSAMGLKLVEIMINDFTELPAYEMGIIDQDGNKIREPKTKEEHDQYNYFVKVAISLKKLMLKKMPASSIQRVTDPLILVKESSEISPIYLFFNELYKENDEDINKFVIETFSGDIAQSGGNIFAKPDITGAEKRNKFYNRIKKRTAKKLKQFQELYFKNLGIINEV